MWNPFKKKPQQAQPRQNRIDEIADKLHKEHRIWELESELQKWKPQELVGDELESWHRYNGTAAFQRGDHKTAFDRFSTGLRACPESQFLRFSLGQEYEHFGQTAEMFRLFDETHFPQLPAPFVLAEARYAYLWDKPDKAEAYLKPILDAYYKLRIADDTFLFMRGLPFFSETWAYLGLFMILQNRLDAWRTFTNEAAQKLSDYDFEGLKQEVECVRLNHFKDLIAQRETRMAEWKGKGFPAGYDQMRIAVLRSQRCPEIQKAEEMLNAASIEANDFKWLEDIRLLARCELAYRARDKNREIDLQKEFFAKQPFLFEPSHVLNFNLWRYQERLKPIYQVAKKRNAQ